MPLFLRPFRIGDYIDAEGIAGTIDEAGLFTTQMHTYDGIYLQVPNGQLWNRAISNYSRPPTRKGEEAMGQFRKGNPGGPGRPRGSTSKPTEAVH